MSPTEFELRRSLRAGEGERPDADTVIERAVASRRDRRMRVAAMIGAAATVVGVAGVALLMNTEPRGKNQAGNAPPVSVEPLPCPAAFQPVQPTNGDGPLFPKDVGALTVCKYEIEGMLTSFTLQGQQAGYAAQQLEDTLNGAAEIACTMDYGPNVLLLANTPSGPAAPVAGNLGGCGTISNGQVSRHAKSVLLDLLDDQQVNAPPASSGANTLPPDTPTGTSANGNTGSTPGSAPPATATDLPLTPKR